MPNSTPSLRSDASVPSLTRIEAEIARRTTSRDYARDAKSVRARCKTLHGFIREAWHVLLPDQIFEDNWHIELICKHLEAITYGKMIEAGYENRLLVNVPPGSMKSLLIGVFWLAWEWGPAGMPFLQALTASYKIESCTRDSLRFAKLVASEWYRGLWGDDVVIIKRSEGYVENARGGHRRTVAYKSLTNLRADRLILDDPHSVDTAESDAERDKAILTFRESATSRLNNPKLSAIVVVMQRLHERDISGVILALKMPYIHIMLPMRFEPERRCVTPFGEDPRTKEGELMFIGRFPMKVVDRDEAGMGSHATAGQYQQRPSPRGGLRFKRHWFKIVKAAPEHCRWVRGWDLAASVDKHSAYTAGVLLGWDARLRHYYIKHVTRARVLNPEPMIVATAQQDGKRVEIDLPKDPGSAGKIQAGSLVAALSGYQAMATPESGDKIERAEPVAAQAEAGNMSLVEGPWNEDFLIELEKFPAGQYKDQVDALSRAFGRFIMQPGSAIVVPIVTLLPSQHFGDYPE